MRARLLLIVGLGLVAAITGMLLITGRGPQLPQHGSDEYEEITRRFYAGLAALEVGLPDTALKDFSRAAEIVPEEPASWANMAIARLRLGELDLAAEPIQRAVTLAEDHAGLALLAARMEIARGQLDAGIAQLRRAVELDPDALKARFTLAEELERSGTPDGDEEALRLLDELLERVPSNVPVLIERARVSAKIGDAARLRESVDRIGTVATNWPDIAMTQYTALQQAAAGGDYTQAARATALLRNVLARVPSYGSDLARVRTPVEIVAEPFDEFIRLPAPHSAPSPPDLTVTFAHEELGTEPIASVTPVFLDEGQPPALFTIAAGNVRRLDEPSLSLSFPGGIDPQVRPGEGLLALDWDNDFRADLLAAGGGGVRLFIQSESGDFEDRTAQASSGTPLTCECRTAWAADLDMDGDLDVVLAVRGGATFVLRNNGDSTWSRLETFAGVTDAHTFAFADLDDDGDPDASFLGSDGLRIFLNGRDGTFAEAGLPETMREADALAVADIDADGRFDILLSGRNGSVSRITWRDEEPWEVAELLPAGDAAVAGPAGAVRLFAADLDNNGALDLLRSGTSTQVWLADEAHRLQPLAATPDIAVTAIVDLDGDGRLDLAGVRDTPVRMLGRGEQPYHWKQIRVRAQATAGDQRINPFAVGGEIEVRSGLLRQKQLLTGGPAHFGLGTHSTIDLARIVWPNGNAQAEFGLEVDDTIVAEQRLKGSCPWVFTYDGTGMQFVTDFLWRSPLGLRINAQDTAGINQTEDWIRIRGDQLGPRDGLYDVRITAELWETHFFDHVSLTVVDHPDETEVFVDERFSSDPVSFRVHTVSDLRPVTQARDQRGADVTALVSARDGQYLSTFERGHYQGIAREHYVELDLAHDPGSPRLLIAQGWVYPTDSSINLAVSQGSRERPRALALEYETADGRWIVADPDLGFPAGKNKTLVIDLAAAGNARRIRLRSNMEISWDALATALPSNAPVRTTRLPAATAELRYRGFSRTVSPRGEMPETPDYAHIETTAQRWRDLVGYYTRFGDVRELIFGVDDRYVIMNAGDELAITFPVPEAPAAGWSRDFILVGDGWEKDGDFNTEFSTTVLPLPSHGPVPYDASKKPGALEDDPVYQRHPSDWEHYHTRFVRPDRFARGR
jgi:tetratricopeptide (TPR) repeat protein